MSIEKHVLKYIVSDETQLAKHEIELAVTDEIASYSKNIIKFLNEVNKADASIQKQVIAINALYKPIQPNLGYVKTVKPKIDALRAKFEKLAKDLGVSIQGTPADKQLGEIYSQLSQIDDSMTSITDNLKTIGK